jgi:hypothetical protein
VAGILHEVSGTTGPLRDVTVTRDPGLFATTYSASGTVDLQQLQTGLTTDPAVVAALSNQKVDVNAIDQALLADIRDAFGLKVQVSLPGGTTTITGTSGKTTAIDASTSVLDSKRVVLVVVAVVLVILALLVLLWPGRRRRRRGRGSTSGRPRRRSAAPQTDPA